MIYVGDNSVIIVIIILKLYVAFGHIFLKRCRAVTRLKHIDLYATAKIITITIESSLFYIYFQIFLYPFCQIFNLFIKL